MFVLLNAVDAWLTGQLLDLGNYEFNPIVSSYGSNISIKVAASLAIAVTAIRFGKARLLVILNIGMLAVTLWNGIWLAVM